jgi:hypothetical protein
MTHSHQSDSISRAAATRTSELLQSHYGLSSDEAHRHADELVDAIRSHGGSVDTFDTAQWLKLIDKTIVPHIETLSPAVLAQVEQRKAERGSEYEGLRRHFVKSDSP